MPATRIAPPILALLVSALGCGAQDLQLGGFVPPVIAPSAGGEGTITKIASRDRVPLTGPRVDAKPGDWLLENAGSVAVVSADGKIIDFGARGGRDDLDAINPTVFLGFDGAHVEVVKIEPVGPERRVLHVVRRAFE